MPEHAHDPRPDPESRPPGELHSPRALSLWAYLERQLKEYSNGPTMADIVEDLDQYRRADGPSSDEIVHDLHESRRERDERWEAV